MGRPGEHLERPEPGPPLTPAIRRVVISMLAALLLEAARTRRSTVIDKEEIRAESAPSRGRSRTRSIR